MESVLIILEHIPFKVRNVYAMKRAAGITHPFNYPTYKIAGNWVRSSVFGENILKIVPVKYLGSHSPNWLGKTVGIFLKVVPHLGLGIFVPSLEISGGHYPPF